MSDKCLIGLSPMDDVTDMPFRTLCKQMGADVVTTEFIASEALNREAEKSLRKMLFDDEQRPVGVQVFGANEQELLQCLEVVEKTKPDFIDVNWGCPVKKVAGKGAGAGMLRFPDRLVSLTATLVKHTSLPLTVKTRLGYDSSDMPIVELAERLQDVGVQAITIHGRTKTQMYSGCADWTLIGQVKNNPRMHIPVLGNGDITSGIEAYEAWQRYGVDGVLIGRAAIGNPWIFEQCKRVFLGKEERNISVAERATVCKKHLNAEVLLKGERVAVIEMRKHYAGYFKGIPSFKPYRMALVSAISQSEVNEILDKIALQFSNN
ncbi:MAG: tRNA-dihydrouridine synthase [Bacteroidales bacterium]|nr:tRNA-dihydrouridine synthase [Bacteroidales bacterium]